MMSLAACEEPPPFWHHILQQSSETAPKLLHVYQMYSCVIRGKEQSYWEGEKLSVGKCGLFTHNWSLPLTSLTKLWFMCNSSLKQCSFSLIPVQSRSVRYSWWTDKHSQATVQGIIMYRFQEHHQHHQDSQESCWNSEKRSYTLKYSIDKKPVVFIDHSSSQNIN